MRKFFLIMILGLSINNLKGQASSTTHWFNVQLPVVFNQHWQWLNEVSYRTLGESFSMNQLFLRNGVRYTINQNWNVGASADFVFTRIAPDKSEHHFGEESRLWEEVNYQVPLKKQFSLQNRLRIEERFFDATIRKDAYRAIRFRYRLNAAKEISDKWSIQVADEILEQLQDGSLHFNQNRVSVSGIYQFQTASQMQATYYWAKLPAGSQHIFALIFQKKIIVHHKKKASA